MITVHMFLSSQTNRNAKVWLHQVQAYARVVQPGCVHYKVSWILRGSFSSWGCWVLTKFKTGHMCTMTIPWPLHTFTFQKSCNRGKFEFLRCLTNFKMRASKCYFHHSRSERWKMENCTPRPTQDLPDGGEVSKPVSFQVHLNDRGKGLDGSLWPLRHSPFFDLFSTSWLMVICDVDECSDDFFWTLITWGF